MPLVRMLVYAIPGDRLQPRRGLGTRAVLLGVLSHFQHWGWGAAQKFFTPAAPAPPPEWTGGFGGAARSEAGFVLDAMSPTLTSVSPKGQQPPPRVPGPARPRDRAGCRGPSRLTPAFFFFFFFHFTLSLTS